ncbi:MAG TPA: PD-(D/E)XK nuclease family protein, partial [Acidimicrobiales bacterium]
ERTAVLFGAAEPYGRLVHEHLAAAGIARNGTAVRPLAATVVGRVLVDVLALPDHGFRRADVMGLLTRAAPRLPGGAPAPAGAWERMSREAGVVAGRADWDRLLTRLAEGHERRAADVEAGADPADETSVEQHRARADHIRRRAQHARDLRDTVLGLIDELAAAAAEPRPWRTRVRWLRRLAGRLLGGERERAGWPPDEHRAADKIDAALDRLVTLDRVDGPAPLDVFRRTLALELEADLGRVGRFGEGVLVAPVSFAVGLDLDLVVVVGLAEGTLPAGVRDDSLLPDAERRRAAGELPLRRERVERDHRHLRAALGGARRHLLCAPRGDLRVSNERVPSRWLLDVASALHGRPLASDQLLALRAPWLDHVPSFAHAVTHTTFPATEQEYRLRAGPDRAPDAVAAAGAAVVRARRSAAFTRFDGNLSGAGLPTPVDGTVSSTRLESWATCPHAYFVRQLLRVEPAETPERQLAITPIDRGSLVHDVLERYVSSVLARDPADRPGPDDPWTADDH